MDKVVVCLSKIAREHISKLPTLKEQRIIGKTIEYLVYRKDKRVYNSEVHYVYLPPKIHNTTMKIMIYLYNYYQKYGQDIMQRSLSINVKHNVVVLANFCSLMVPYFVNLKSFRTGELKVPKYYSINENGRLLVEEWFRHKEKEKQEEEEEKEDGDITTGD